MSEKKEFPDDFIDWTGPIELLAKMMMSHPVTKVKYRVSIQQLQTIFTGGGSGSADGGVLESIAAMNAAAQGKFYGVQLPDVHPELAMDHFALICIRGGAAEELVQVAIGFDGTMKIYLRGGEANNYSDFSQISGGGGVGTETDPVFMTWLATNPISHFFGNNTLEFASADLLDDLFATGDYGIHVASGFHGQTNMNLTVKFASNDGTGGDGDQDYFQIIKFDTGEEFIRKYEHTAGGGNWSAWESKIALQQWVTDNFTLKESGVIPPVSEDILLTTAAPSYTVVAETADNINVSSTAASGTIVLNVLAADKALKISIKTGSNAVTIAGTAYNAGVVVFAVFTESTGTWSVDSTLDPVIPDYSDIKVQKRVTTAPTQSGWTYIISGIPAGGGAKGHLIFVDIAGSAFSGVYSSLVNFAGTTTYAQKIIEGTALNVVRVGSGSVYHSEYDGANLASLKFNITVSLAEKTIWNKDTIPLVCSDEISDLTASTTVSKLHYVFRDSFTRTVNSIIADLNVAPTGSSLTIDVKKNGTSIFSTLLTIDATETSNTTASVPYVLTGAITFVAGDSIDVYVNIAGSVTAGKGLKINLLTTKS